jgi:hypothetical protein
MAGSLAFFDVLNDLQAMSDLGQVTRARKLPDT